MAVDKPPVKAVIGTSVGAGGLRGLVTALLTVIALLLNVLTTGGVGFTCDNRIVPL